MGSMAIRQTAVALIGAGTQGRRLAHMWTSCGSNVHLIDEKPSQLRDALAYVDELRKRPEYQKTQWGSITTHSPEALDGALKDSWLAIEVDHPVGSSFACMSNTDDRACRRGCQSNGRSSRNLMPLPPPTQSLLQIQAAIPLPR